MATTRSFNAMLNQFLPNKLLREEMLKRDYVLQKIEKNDGWKGGELIVPFKGAGASSIEFGQLPASTDISSDVYVRGSITDYVECWGSLIFNHRDILDHSGQIPETTFLDLLPDVIEDFMENMKRVVSVALTSGSHFATMTAETDLANGVCEVDKIDRFSIGQKVTLDDGNSAAGDYYVIAINVNAGANSYGTVTLSATRGGAAANISAYTIAQSAKFYHPGVLTNGTFNSLRSSLLSLANGGSANLHGVAKLSYPYLQATNVSGASITESNILDKLFDAYNEVRRKAKGGNANELLMSFKHLGSIMKLIEVQKGGYKVTASSSKASMYGWTEIEITSVKGNLKLVGIQEMDDDVIFIIDWKALKFHSNGFFRKRKSPDGNEFFEIRNTTGYQYVVDSCLFGELEVRAPGHCGIIYSISY